MEKSVSVPVAAEPIMGKEKVDPVPLDTDNVVAPAIYKKGQLVARRSKPGQALHIYNEPYWSKIHGQWCYDYDYNLGLTSEGSALEGELIIAPKGSVL